MRQPIKKLDCHFELDSRTLQLTTPWCCIDLEIDDSQINEVNGIQYDLKSNVGSKQLATCLEFLADYPISVLRPRSYVNFKEKNLTIPLPRTFSELDIRTRFSLFEKRQEAAEWPFHEICAFSSVGDNLFDPASAHSKIIESVLCADPTFACKKKLTDTLISLRQSNEPAFFDAIELMLTQTFFVTSNCVSTLTPATQWPNESLYEFCRLIHKFQRQEAGHHFLIKDSIIKLGRSKVNFSKTFPETENLMGLLKYTALTSPLAFSCLLSIFEGNNYNAMDPLATLLLSSTKPQAARGLQRHHEINLKENHGKIGERAALRIPLVTARDISDAIIAVDTMTHLVLGQLNRILNSLVCHD